MIRYNAWQQERRPHRRPTFPGGEYLKLTALGIAHLPAPPTPQAPTATGTSEQLKNMSIQEFLSALHGTDRPANANLTQAQALDMARDWAYTAVTTIADRMMDLDIYLTLERRTQGTRESQPVEDHVFLDLLDNPNPQNTREELTQFTWINLLLAGNSYWHTPLDERYHTPRAIIPLPADQIGMAINRNTLETTYIWKEAGDRTLIPSEQLIHFRLPSAKNPYFGASPIEAFAFAHDISVYSQIYQVRYFQNSATPEYVVTFPANVPITQKDIDQIWSTIRRKHQGVEKAHLPLVLGRGGEAKPIGIPNADARYLQASEITRDRIICGAYKVPLAAAGMVADFNRANSQWADIAFNKQCIKPKATMFVARINKDLLERHYPQPKGYRLRLNYTNPVPTDRELEILEREHYIRMGLKSRNQILSEIGEQAVDNGDELLIQSGLVPYEALSLTPPAPDPETGAPPDKTQRVSEAKAATHEQPTHSVIITPESADPALWKLATHYLTKDGARFYPNALREELHKRHVARLSRQELPMRSAMRSYFRDLGARLAAGLEARWPAVERELPTGKSAEKRLRIARQKDLLDDLDLFDETAEAAALAAIAFKYLTPAMQETVRRLAEALGGGKPTEDAIQRILRERVFKFRDQVARYSAEEIRRVLLAGVAEGQSIQEMNKHLTRLCNNWATFRSARIARTEVNGATNSATILTYTESGKVEQKAWITSVDERTRTWAGGAEFDHEAMNGAKVGVNEYFEVESASGGTDLLESPGDYAGDPADIINCRCSTIPVIED